MEIAMGKKCKHCWQDWKKYEISFKLKKQGAMKHMSGQDATHLRGVMLWMVDMHR